MAGSHEEIQEDDSEESFISQFETTLTIRPSTGIPEDQDLSIDHTTLFNTTQKEPVKEDHKVDLGQRVNDLEARDKTSNSTSTLLASNKSTKIRVPDDNTTYLPRETVNVGDIEILQALQPSTFIDLELTRFTSTFKEFIDANPQIERESPRFENEMDKTLIILSPLSPEHAFGRKWVTKSYLATIFERPQRLLACCIGISAALTMFPYYYSIKNSTKKSSLFAGHVKRVHGRNWPQKLHDLCIDSHEKLKKNEIEVPEDWNSGDIYLTPKTLTALEGVLGAIETAIDSLYANKDDSQNYRLVFTAIRPPGHHSHACLPGGFCVLNNAHIGIEYANEKYGVTHCAILDIDLHHGDGTQDICWERAGFLGDYGKSDEDADVTDENPRDQYGKKFATYPKVGYFSLHDVKSYPTELGYATKENIKNASLCIMDHDINLWNVHLQEWSTEEEFYKLYQTKYVALLNRANQFLNHSKKQHDQLNVVYMAELVKYNKFLLKAHPSKQQIQRPKPPPPFKPLIMISSGFDASEYENPQMQRHSINVPTSFYSKFTKDVVKLAQIHTEGKVVSLLEGGYSDGALISGIFSHLIGLNNVGAADSEDTTLWNETWGTEHVVKELSKGCKKTWMPYKNPRTEITIWSNEVIKLGRSMMPNSILPPDYVYSSKHSTKEETTNSTGKPANRILRGILDQQNLQFLQTNISPGTYNEGEETVRHTRSYFKKNSK